MSIRSITSQKPVFFIRLDAYRRTYEINSNKLELSEQDIQRIVELIKKRHFPNEVQSRPRDYRMVSLYTPSTAKYQRVARKTDSFFQKLAKSKKAQPIYHAHDGITYRELSDTEYKELLDLEKEILLLQSSPTLFGDKRAPELLPEVIRGSQKRPFDDKKSPHSIRSFNLATKRSKKIASPERRKMDPAQKIRNSKRRSLAQRDKEEDHRLLVKIIFLQINLL